MPKVTEEHLETRRRQIMDAAFLCFARKGFHPTTMQDICAEAQLSPGAVYRYFDSKEEIIEAFCRESGEQQIPFLAESSGQGGFTTLVRLLAEHYFPQLDGPQAEVTNRATVQVWAEAVVSQRVHAINEANMETVRSVLKEVVASAQANVEVASDIEPESLARVMVSIYHGFLLQKALDPQVDTRAYAQAAVALLTGNVIRTSDSLQS